MVNTRTAFHGELEAVTQSLIDLNALVSDAMSKATTAILDGDLGLAEEVITADQKIDQLQHALDAEIVEIIARQQPVASDLRSLVGALRIATSLERMGDLAVHVAKIARMRHPEKAVPAELVELVNSMGMAAKKIAVKTGHVIASRNAELAAELERDDDEMDALHRKLIAILIEKPWTHSIETAIDMTLLGRYYERYCDHSVSLSRCVYYLVKGEYA